MTTIHAFNDNVSAPFVNDETTLSIPLDSGMTLAEFERIVILETLKRHSQNRTHTARALGIGIRTLQRKIKQYGAEQVLDSTSLTKSETSSAVRSVAHFY